MSAFSDKNFDAHQYSSFRPTYPSELYEMLIRYHSKGNDGQLNTILDLGCGPGEASIPLLRQCTGKIVATDLSSTMIEVAKTNFQKALTELHLTNQPAVTVAVSPSEDVSSVLPEDGTVDLVVAAECVHWFQWDKWLTEMNRVLKEGGTLAYFAYCDPVFVGNSKMDEIYERFTCESGELVGPYWQQPGRSRLRHLCKELNDIVLADGRFTDVRVEYYEPLKNPSKKEKMVIERNYTMEAFMKYVDTWSASHRWNMAHNGKDENAAETFYKIVHQELGWTKQTEFPVSWKTMYVFARKL
ncbi:hypothetical protein FOA43_000128 [Brettanomyces nanus]|uniref:Methyltransferase domain-containing protein n=1 Tax=Eeniella nana TaxID=13502 RepID=A0A875RVY9_EENNA|nr:uncharacterized protein FOA43_000128 [Brettanomyces nanus]QPG72826.1 hypothetical protein FOA43_000128 [Brettanomyces nanus]